MYDILSMKKGLLILFLFCFFIARFSYAEVVKELKVVGNHRISPETIVVFGDIQIN